MSTGNITKIRLQVLPQQKLNQFLVTGGKPIYFVMILKNQAKIVTPILENYEHGQAFEIMIDNQICYIEVWNYDKCKKIARYNLQQVMEDFFYTKLIQSEEIVVSIKRSKESLQKVSRQKKTKIEPRNNQSISTQDLSLTDKSQGHRFMKYEQNAAAYN